MSRLPGLSTFSEDLSKLLGKKPETLRVLIKSNVKHLLENIPADEILKIFEEE